MSRIHILGAAGSGTSTLGAALARRLRVPHTDADHVYWLPSEPPFTTPRPRLEREKLLRQRLPATGAWVFSGAATKWAASRETYYDLVVFLRLDPAVRMVRLRQREAVRYGERILPHGDMAAIHAAFIGWAESYDTAGSSNPGLLTDEAWLTDQPAPVLRLNSQASVRDLVTAILDAPASRQREPLIRRWADRWRQLAPQP